jgi:hypothetical protein
MRPRPRTTVALTAAAAAAAAALGAGAAAGTGVPAATGPGAAAATGRGLPVLPLPRPRDFVARVSNPYLPWAPGSRWVYAGRGAEKGERTTVTVLHRTKTIEGIKATVVHDVVREGGALIEDTFDWYAQDRVGNVWYLGERTKEFEDGEVVSTEGSWRAGKGGGHAGIAMPASPELGRRYRQEFDAGNAEDEAQVVLEGGQVRVPAGRYHRVRVTDETTALEPAVDEMKFYAPGVGVVLELGVSPRFSRSVLVRVHLG